MLRFYRTGLGFVGVSRPTTLRWWPRLPKRRFRDKGVVCIDPVYPRAQYQPFSLPLRDEYVYIPGLPSCCTTLWVVRTFPPPRPLGLGIPFLALRVRDSSRDVISATTASSLVLRHFPAILLAPVLAFVSGQVHWISLLLTIYTRMVGKKFTPVPVTLVANVPFPERPFVPWRLHTSSTVAHS